MINKELMNKFPGTGFSDGIGCSKCELKTNNDFRILGIVLKVGIIVFVGMYLYKEVKKNELNQHQY